MKRLFMLTGIAIACSVVATAQDDKNTDDLFKQLDKNNDGKLVADEISKEKSRFFERLIRLGDADKNGELTRSEFTNATSESTNNPPAPQNADRAGRRPGNPQARQADSSEFFKRLDKNGDGKVALSELPEQFASRLAPAFKSLGKDAITLEEFQQLRQKMEQGRPGQPGGRQGQMGDPAEMFKQLDSNKDGKITIDEVPEQGRRMVAAILERSGKGRDGSLNQQEFQKAVEQFNRSQQGGRPSDRKPQNSQRDNDKPNGDRSMRDQPQGNRPQNGGPAFLRILDVNKDGRLSRDELAKAVTLIDRLDQNGDGSLDGRELFGPPPGNGRGSMDRPRQAGDTKPSDRPRRPESEDSKNGQRREKQSSTSDQPNRERGTSNVSLEQNFGRMDQNKDGVISKEEAPDRLKQNFDRVDSNKDGEVTLEELRKIFERSRKQ
jgi:Ca2+-binding EF-hand superfamily protein